MSTNPAVALCRVGLAHTLSILKGPVTLITAIVGPGAIQVGANRYLDNIYRQNQTYFYWVCRSNGGQWTPLYDSNRRVYGDCLCPMHREAVRIHNGNMTVPDIACGPPPTATQ